MGLVVQYIKEETNVGKEKHSVKLISFHVNKQKNKKPPENPEQRQVMDTWQQPMPPYPLEQDPYHIPPDRQEIYPIPARPARRQKRKNRLMLVLGLFLLLVFAVIILVQYIIAGLQPSEDAHLTYIDGIPVHEDFVAEGAMARPGEKRKIMYVVIHETDNESMGADAKAHNNFIHTNGVTNELSWHYTVDDHEIWHHIPDDETAFHAGDHMDDKGGNKNGIGVEMCVNADGNYEATLRNAQKLAAALLHEYGLSIRDLKKHQDFSGKNCPSKLLNANRWDEFTSGVQDELEQIKQEEKNAEKN